MNNKAKRNYSIPNKRRLVHVLLSHLTAMLAIIVIICFIIDRFNTAMEFMTSELSRWLIGVLALLALITSVLTIIGLWVKPRENRETGDRRQR